MIFCLPLRTRNIPVLFLFHYLTRASEIFLLSSEIEEFVKDEKMVFLAFDGGSWRKVFLHGRRHPVRSRFSRFHFRLRQKRSYRSRVNPLGSPTRNSIICPESRQKRGPWFLQAQCAANCVRIFITRTISSGSKYSLGHTAEWSFSDRERALNRSPIANKCTIYRRYGVKSYQKPWINDRPPRNPTVPRSTLATIINYPRARGSSSSSRRDASNTSRREWWMARICKSERGACKFGRPLTLSFSPQVGQNIKLLTPNYWSSLVIGTLERSGFSCEQWQLSTVSVSRSSFLELSNAGK